MAVTKNLYMALLHLKQKNEDQIIWIDSICIDQLNDKEKNHQVCHMSSINKMAESVIIWLGEATAETDFVIAILDSFWKRSMSASCSTWKPHDQRWLGLWTTVQADLWA
jgi:hypothetical protein